MIHKEYSKGYKNTVWWHPTKAHALASAVEIVAQ